MERLLEKSLQKLALLDAHYESVYLWQKLNEVTREWEFLAALCYVEAPVHAF